MGKRRLQEIQHSGPDPEVLFSEGTELSDVSGADSMNCVLRALEGSSRRIKNIWASDPFSAFDKEGHDVIVDLEGVPNVDRVTIQVKSHPDDIHDYMQMIARKNRIKFNQIISWMRSNHHIVINGREDATEIRKQFFMEIEEMKKLSNNR